MLGIGHLSKPVVVQGRKNMFSHMKKGKCVAEGGNKALIPQSLKINSYARLKRWLFLVGESLRGGLVKEIKPL